MYKVMVFLSAYNGEKYLKQQIDSILNQKEVMVFITVRDDGSCDETLEIIKDYARQYNNISYISGNNIGFRKSFWKLLRSAENKYDYYAFSDQDDVWYETKLRDAVKVLQTDKNKYQLYATGMDVVSDKLEHLSCQTFPKLRISYGSALSRQRLAGCTMVFNRGLFELCHQIKMDENKDEIISHDGLLYYTCLLCGGKLFFRQESSMMFRRHAETVTEQGKGLWAKIRTLFRVFGRDRNKRFRQTLYLYNNLKDMITDENKALVELIMHYRDNWLNTIKLSLCHEINCGLLSVDISNRMAILCRRY